VASGAGDARVVEGQAWHGAGACEVAAGDAGAALLRYELIRGNGAGGRRREGAPRASDRPRPRAEYLIRADRVDFALGGMALPHRHRGGGIRCLIAGALEVTVGDAPARRVTPGGAWFESGREPVLAVASKAEDTSFIRVAILPREIRGRTSIMYVNPADAERGGRARTRYSSTSRSTSPEAGAQTGWAAHAGVVWRRDRLGPSYLVGDSRLRWLGADFPYGPSSSTSSAHS
jgi:hypothetical protein